MGVVGPHGIDHLGLRHKRVEGVKSNLSLLACVLIGIFMLSKKNPASIIFEKI